MPIVISAEHEYRVWVKVILPKNFSFGPFEGDLNSLIQRVQGLEQSPSKFEALYWRDAVAEHDTSQGDVSWMQRVNPARCREEQNMEASRTEHDQIMFRSTREITAGEELRVWLDQSLEEENAIKRCEEDEFEVRQAICKNCQESFRYTRALAVHVAFGCRGKASRTINCSAHDNEVPSNCDKSLEAGKAVEHFEVTVSSTGWDTTENEDEVMRATLKFPRFGFPESTGSRINKHSPAVLGNSQVLSDPKLAWLISSFPRPRFRKFTTSNGPESLAEYHKQEFRRKFRGNEHYLRRHLYRQNIQKMVSSGNYRRTVTRKEVSQCSLQSFQEFQDIKQEKDEFSNSSGEDCSSTHLSSILVNSACGTGIADPPRCNFPIENLPLGGSLNINTSFLNASKEPVVTRGHSTANVPETHKECPLHADHGQCACKLFADKLSPREMLRSEKNVDMADGMVKSGKEERILHIAPKSQISSVESQSSFTRLGSHYAYHDTQQEVLSYQHLQYQCCSTRSVCVPNNNPLRYHEPAFFVTPMYHYSNLPRIFPYFAHQTAHSSQGSMRTQGFKCNYCGKVYCRKYVLKIHMRTHTGFKPLRCKVCDKSFSDPSNMKKHVKLHESEDTIHKCRYCGRNFVRYRGLLNHIKSKHSGHISISNTM